MGSVGNTESGVNSRLVPRHVAVIMDGNGRWAEGRGLDRTEGHKAGTENIRRVLKCFVQFGVKCLTLFTFSTENWNRPQDEIEALMELLGVVITEEASALHQEGVCIRHIGRVDRLSPRLLESIRNSVELTKENSSMVLNVAFDYGGRAEIVDAVRSILRDGLDPNEITENVFQGYLSTRDLPDPDLVIRTAGEMRLSNFLLWQTAYSEYYSTPVLWPDFDEAEVSKAIEVYGRRKRKYGTVIS